MMTEPLAAVLFACNLNRVRSPMAAGLMRLRYGDAVFADSRGLEASGEVDPFAVAVMAERGVDLSDYVPKPLDTFADDSFDVVVALTAEARAQAEALTRGRAVELVYWPLEDPTLTHGSRDQRLDAYRRCRDTLESLIANRFGPPGAQ